MHELPWITIFGSWVRRFANYFHKWRSHEWKSLASRITSDPKIVIHGNECILFLICYLMSLNTHPLEKSSMAHFAIVAKDGLFWLGIVTSPQLICDVTRTWSTGIVTSYSSIVLVYWCKGDLHRWIPTVNIHFSPPSIHGLTCKKILLLNENNNCLQ